MNRILQELSNHLGARDRAVTGVAFDSRRVEPGHAFFALAGSDTHGIHFADDALARGAALVVSDRPHPRGLVVPDPTGYLLALGSRARDAWAGPVIGITGSVGRTSTKDLLAAALDAPASPGNRNTTLALAAELINLLGTCEGSSPLVLELGIDHVGEMAELLELVRPSYGLVTAIAETHLEGLGDLATIAGEKARLLESAAHPYAHAEAAAMLTPELRARVTSYGLPGEGADAEAAITADPAGPPQLALGGRIYRLPGVGRSAARNAAGALALATGLGVEPERAARRMARAALAPGRLHLQPLAGATLIDDSYNSSPTSLGAALDVLQALPAPRTAILGDMLELGPRAEELHARFSDRVLLLDRLWTVGPLARLIAPGHPDALRLADADEAAAAAAGLALEGTVLVKGSRGVRLELVADALRRSGGVE